MHIRAVSYVYGLAGRDFTVGTACSIFDEVNDAVENDKELKQHRYVGLRTREGQ